MYFSIAVLITFGCHSNNITQNKVTGIEAEKIIIKYVEPSIETFYSVSCNGFENMFSDEKKEIVIIKNSHDFILVDSLLALFKDDTSIKSIDVRVKILANSKNDSIICMDEMGHFFSAYKNKYMRNELLKKFVLKAIYSKRLGH